MKEFTERELFEFWAKRQGHCLDRSIHVTPTIYVWPSTNDAWTAWKAGRAALKRAQRRTGGAR